MYLGKSVYYKLLLINFTIFYLCNLLIIKNRRCYEIRKGMESSMSEMLRRFLKKFQFFINFRSSNFCNSIRASNIIILFKNWFKISFSHS